ncbi:MAG: hypothetical protein QOF56_3117, partial [Acidobacteriaceae bacterium]|nr:hypothetical protein [Acidobacteriaceae bacterium]
RSPINPTTGPRPISRITGRSPISPTIGLSLTSRQIGRNPISQTTGPRPTSRITGRSPISPTTGLSRIVRRRRSPLTALTQIDRRHNQTTVPNPRGLRPIVPRRVGTSLRPSGRKLLRRASARNSARLHLRHKGQRLLSSNSKSRNRSRRPRRRSGRIRKSLRGFRG